MNHVMLRGLTTSLAFSDCLMCPLHSQSCLADPVVSHHRHRPAKSFLMRAEPSADSRIVSVRAAMAVSLDSFVSASRLPFSFGVLVLSSSTS